MNVLVTGGAGFIGSNLVAGLLADPLLQKLRVLDNLSTGLLQNLEPFRGDPRFEFVQGDIRDYDTCLRALDGITHVSHQAALGSVPRSIADPRTTHDVNITGALNVFTASKEKNIRRIVYAASSSTYGDHPGLPKVEDTIGRPLSPYAVTKLVNELYADVYASLYGMQFIGLRYFNIFGPGQNPQGPYAAVIPLFMKAVLNNHSPIINGDGSHSRDFTYVGNAVSANILALKTQEPAAMNQVYNIACGKQTSLLELFSYIQETAGSRLDPVFGPGRQGDVLHSLADISKAERLLGYRVLTDIREAINSTYGWYKNNPERL